MTPEMITRMKETGILGAHVPLAIISVPYRLMSVMGALIASLFVLAYIALLPLAGWAIYRLTSAFGSVPVGTLNALLGLLVILSLLKPLLAPPARRPELQVLDPDEELMLFAFVKELSSSAGLPVPSDMAVDCSVNCHCVFSGGITGIFRSDFVLVIGLPLAAGLRLDQFAGALAHELGHAAETKAASSGRIIWTVNSWFSRVALERDRLDEQLLHFVVTGRPALRLASRGVQGIALVGRAVLRILLVAESAFLSVVLRRAELEADRHQVRLVGTEAFISAVCEINLLEVAAHRAFVELSGMKRQGTLVDNYPGLIAAIRSRYSAEFVQRLLSGIAQGRTGIFSPHPSDRDRISLARVQKRPAILSADLQAATLFAHFDALCHEATLEFYKRELRIGEEGWNCVPLQDALGGDSTLM